MKNLSLLPLALSLVVFAPACDSGGSDDGETNSGEETATDTNASGDGDGDTVGDGDGDGDSTSTTGAEPIATVSGSIVGADGTGINTAGGQICGPVDHDAGTVQTCIPINENDDGTWAADVFDAGDYNLKWVHPDDEDGTVYSTAIEIVPVSDMDIVIEKPFKVPAIANSVDLTDAAAGDVDMGDGLVMTIDPAAMDWPLGITPNAGGVRIDAADWRYDNIDGEAIVAIWALTPFGGHPTADGETVPFVINDALGLEAGATVNFYYPDKETAAIKSAGSGTVSMDATSIASDDGIRYITHLIVTTP